MNKNVLHVDNNDNLDTLNARKGYTNNVGLAGGRNNMAMSDGGMTMSHAPPDNARPSQGVTSSNLNPSSTAFTL